MRLITLATALCLAGCSIASNPFVVDGSRADGKIIVHSGATTEVANEVDWLSQEAIAIQRCLEWGYDAAKPFGGVRSRIITVDEWGQRIWEHELIYQCITDSEIR